MLYVGIDPGKQGAVAVIGPLMRYSAGRLSWDDRRLVDWLTAELAGEQATGMLEHVHSMPRDGRASAFAFGASFGKCQMLLAACGIEYELVAPQRWMRAMDCMTGGDKKISRDKARTMFPQMDIYCWNADAMLIAEYCRRTHREYDSKSNDKVTEDNHGERKP